MSLFSKKNINLKVKEILKDAKQQLPKIVGYNLENANDKNKFECFVQRYLLLEIKLGEQTIDLNQYSGQFILQIKFGQGMNQSDLFVDKPLFNPVELYLNNLNRISSYDGYVEIINAKNLTEAKEKASERYNQILSYTDKLNKAIVYYNKVIEETIKKYWIDHTNKIQNLLK